MKNEQNAIQSYEYATFPRQFVSYKWYKPLLVALLAFVFCLVFGAVLSGLAAVSTGGADYAFTALEYIDNQDGFSGMEMIIGFGMIAIMLPSLVLAVLVVRDRPFSSYSSSRGGFKWSAFFKCSCIALVLYVIDVVVESFVLPGGESVEIAMRYTVSGLVICVLVLPLQCFAEEYVFRGFIMQTVGSWTKLPVVGLLVSAILFAICHEYNLYGLCALLVDGIVWGIIVLRTKGLEATCALHTMNNLSMLFMQAFSLSPVTTDGEVSDLVIVVVIDFVYLTAILLADRKFGWFSPTNDDVLEFNQKHLVKKEA